MRIWLKLAALAGVLAVAAGARCADFAGTWKGAFDFQGNSVPLTFHLSLAGNAVTGTVEGLPTTPAEIHDGRIDGDTVTFSVNTDYQGENYKLVFKGSAASGDGSIHFTLGTEDGSWSSELVAEKAAAAGDAADSAPPAAANSADPAKAGAADVTGTWRGSFDYQGTAVPVTFHFTAKDGALTGTIEGMMEGAPDKPAEIHDGTVDGGAIRFAVDTQYQGETYRIVYKG